MMFYFVIVILWLEAVRPSHCLPLVRDPPSQITTSPNSVHTFLLPYCDYLNIVYLLAPDG